MNYKFSGYISEPIHFNNVGVLILGGSKLQKDLSIKFADWGCLSIVLDIPYAKKDFDTLKTQIISALQFLYRYSEKLVVIGFNEGGYLALKTAEEYDDIDCLLCFDPHIYAVDFIKLKNSPMLIKFFADPTNSKIKSELKTYEIFMKQIGRGYKTSEYDPKDLEVLKEDTLKSNDLLDELFKIIQFI